MQKNNKKNRILSFSHSILFKLISTIIIGGILLTIFMLWALTDSITEIEHKLMDSRLSSDILYLRDSLGENSGKDWNIKNKSLYIGDTLIGDGTLENANEDTFYHCENITGTFYYTFVRTDNDDELKYIESGGYQQGHYMRVAGTTKGPNGENIEGTFIDKTVADVLEKSYKDTGKGVYSGRANVNGRSIYCRYELLLDEDEDIVGVIVVGRSVEEMMDLLKEERIRGIITIFTVLFVICLCICMTIGFMFASIRKIRKRLELIGTGEYPDEPLILKTKDELSYISHSINDMVDSLKEKDRIGAELDVASRIQGSMLPCIFPAFPEREDFDIFATMEPAKEVGGDFYDFFLIDENHLALVMADVSGKGVPAALFMVITKTLIKNSAQTCASPKEIMEKVNQQLCENNEEDMFVTAWLGILEISSGKITCVNAGHERPVLKRKNEPYELLNDKHGFVLGGIEKMRYQEYEIQLNIGDDLFIYTDGVVEATNANNEMFGTERMLNALNENPNRSSRELLPFVKECINDFVGLAPQFDDITMLSFKYLGNKQK